MIKSVILENVLTIGCGLYLITEALLFFLKTGKTGAFSKGKENLAEIS
jgi:hypothetical protein